MTFKYLSLVTCLACLSAPQTSYSGDEANDTEVLARRGKGVVTQSEFAARVERIPAETRFQTLRHKGRLTDLIGNMLLRAQIAVDAREAGYDLDPVVSTRMKLAADKELVDAWLQHYVEQRSTADYEQLAHEYYQINKDALLEPETVDVTHILISTKERTEEDALALAKSLSSQLSADAGIFDQLVLEYSEDPSVESNLGKFHGVKHGDMVKPFENAAFSLKVGEISEPVKTKFGYHLIRLDSRQDTRVLKFEEVKEQLITQERKKHEDRIKSDYITPLNSMGVEITEEAVREMIRRQFGEEVLEQEVKTENSE